MNITHEMIAVATRRYLEKGGVITVQPDTVEEQRTAILLLEGRNMTVVLRHSMPTGGAMDMYAPAGRK